MSEDPEWTDSEWIYKLKSLASRQHQELDRLRAEDAEQHEVMLKQLETIGDLRAENERLLKGIQDYLDGNYEGPPKRKVDQCPHGRFQWEACDQCIDAHFIRVMTSLTTGGEERG